MDAIDVDEVIFNLKATITSSKGGVPLKSIESDYYNINGTIIPYRELGYSSLKQFLQSYKVFKIDESKYETIVNVVSDAKTRHLQDMIKKQKTSKKSKCKRKPKIIHKKFPNDYHTYSKQPTYKKKVPIVSNIRNHTSASSSINTLNSKWIKNYELPIYKKNVTTVSNIDIYKSAVSSTNTQNSKWLKKDKLSNNKIKVTEVSSINNYTSNISSINTTNSRWPTNNELSTYKINVPTDFNTNNSTSDVSSIKSLNSRWVTNNEMNKNKVINKCPVISTKITSLPSCTQKKENHLFQKNKEKILNIGNLRCNNVRTKPKKIMKLFGQSAQDRLQKYVKKDISEIELKSYPIKPIISTDLNYLNQKTSELKITHDNVNETFPMCSEKLNYQETSELANTYDYAYDTISKNKFILNFT